MIPAKVTVAVLAAKVTVNVLAMTRSVISAVSFVLRANIRWHQTEVLILARLTNSRHTSMTYLNRTFGNTASGS
jgi:hypothetical protein